MQSLDHEINADICHHYSYQESNKSSDRLICVDYEGTDHCYYDKAQYLTSEESDGILFPRGISSWDEEQCDEIRHMYDMKIKGFMSD